MKKLILWGLPLLFLAICPQIAQAGPSWCATCTPWPYLSWLSPAGSTGNVTLTRDKSPYYVDTAIKIMSWAKVIIEPGVVIKVGPNYQSGYYTFPITFTVDGQLQAIGSSTAPIIFTSYKDDSAAGDTNNDAAATAPAPGDWGGFILGNTTASSTFDFVKWRYGGNRVNAALDYVFKGSITNSEISDFSSDGLLLRGGSFNESRLIIDHNVIADNGSGLNIQSSFGTVITNNQFLRNRNSGLIIDKTSRNGSLQIKQNNFSGNQLYGLMVSNQDDGGRLEATLNSWGDVSGPYNFSYNTFGIGDKVSDYVDFDPWLDKPTKPDPVILIPGITGSWYVNGSWRLDPILGTYDNLWAALQKAGYQVNQDLFAFPYQWRDSNIITAQLLKQKIAQVKQICNCQKVDLVAHSMGGLVARQYIESDDYANDVDQVIFLGTPHQGSSKAYLTWEGGEFGVYKNDKLYKNLFYIEALARGYSSLADYVQEMVPTVGELLPIYNYLRDKETSIIRNYPTAPFNNFLELLNNNALVQKLLDRVRITNIIGDLGANSTYNIFRVIPSIDELWPDGYPENYYIKESDHGIEYNSGDQTVPLRSSTAIGSQEINSIVLPAEHSALVTTAQKEVIKALTGKEASDYIDHGKVYNVLFITVHSPINLLVTSPAGKKVGFDLINNTSTTEIVGSFYDPDLEIITIPNPESGQYQIQAQGIGEGKYELEMDYLSDEQEITKIFSATTSTGLIHEFALDYNPSSSEPVTNLQPLDNEPPQITIAWPQAQSYLNTGAGVVEFAVSDNLSGVARVTAVLDGQLVNNKQSFDLSLLKVGEHLFSVVATDVNGNVNKQEVVFNLITDWPTFLANLQHYYELGKFKTRGIFISLMVKLINNRNLKSFGKELAALREKMLSDETYQLINEQVKYLLNNK